MANPLVRLANWFGHLFTDEAQAVLPVIDPIIKSAVSQLSVSDLTNALTDPALVVAHLTTIGTAAAAELAAQAIPVAGKVFLTALSGAFTDALTSVEATLGVTDPAPAAPAAS